MRRCCVAIVNSVGRQTRDLIGRAIRQDLTLYNYFIVLLDVTWYPPEDTNIDRGDSRGQYRYSMVDINVISNNTIVNNCFIIFHESLATCIAKSFN